MSDKLMHFTTNDPPACDEKTEQRQEISQHVNEYLAKGGQINALDQNDSASKHLPLRRTKREQIDYVKRRDYQMSNKD